ncbi:hypothetical protein MVEN_02581800 [Mycena venus]|uniref:Uncharacterized protein n=1 Tax=Mycena venus TaxID=2733690 RepID=A0A8H6WQ79_9AGAR|nr:hypothetical protein MVEN_02581800 [Mycena venus]
MAGNSNSIVVFGPSPNSYYVGHGRQHVVENMSASFTNHARTDLNISVSRWISVSKNAQTWVEFNAATNSFHFNGDISRDIQDHINGVNGKCAAEFISFPDSDKLGFFVKGKQRGAWNAILPSYFIERLNTMRREVQNFDSFLTGMLFGKGKTNIILLEDGFSADLDDTEIPSPDHPLHKVLVEFSTPGDGWCIDRGSSLCLYDSRFFFLKFTRPGQNMVRMRWNLPSHIDAKFAALQELAQQPEERMALMQEDQMTMNLARARLNSQIQTNNMVADIRNYANIQSMAASSYRTWFL